MDCHFRDFPLICHWWVAPQNPGTVNLLGLCCSDQQLSFFTLLDRISFPDYNNTKIIKFGWKLFILWVISHGLWFSGFSIIKFVIGGWPPKNPGTVNFLGLCSDQQLLFSLCWIEYLFLIIITLRSSNLVENFFILWVISYGLSFSGFAINLSLVGGPPKEPEQSILLGLCSDQQLSFSPCWIEYLFLIIITPRSSNLVENFLFYE